jgi:hypothetical protein
MNCAADWISAYPPGAPEDRLWMTHILWAESAFSA